MNRRWLLLALACVVGLSACCECGNDRPALAELDYPALTFNPPTTERVELPNGMVLHLYENHELPIVELEGMVRIYGRAVPPEKRGLASLTGSVWRSGGTEDMSPEELDAELEFMGASIETGIGDKSGSINMSVLSKDLDRGLGLLADVIQKPAFNAARFAVVKNQKLEGIRRVTDDPQSLARREFMRLMFKDHPYGVPPTVTSVSSITRREAVRFYKDHVGPESFIIGITGDFDSDEMVKKFKELFADFKPAKEPLPPYRDYPDDIPAGTYLVEKDVPQTVILAGHFGVSRKAEDYFAARVMNYVLGGGGFSSRLLQEIRSDRGLAYSVYSYFSGGETDPGVFIAGGETKAESTAEFLTVMKSIMDDVKKNGVTPEELKEAKESIVNSFVHNFDKDIKVISHMLWLEYFALPKDYLETFRANVDSVTGEDVKRAAEKYLHPDRMVVLAVGNPDTMGDGFTEPGNVTRVEPIQ